MKYHKDIFEIIFFARGGQGAKTAAEIIAQAATGEGKFVQAFPNFGPERSGAPTKTYLRLSDSPIRTHEPVIDPDVVVVLDDTLIDSQDVTFNLDKKEALVINTTMSEHEIREKIVNISKAAYEGQIYAVDASGISLEVVGQPRPNTVILGKFIQVTEAVKLESVILEFRKIFEAKIGKENCEKNVLAIEKAYDTI
ncbi:MAG: 2-oxoacid:acceptor oxidoreductase family protein [Candidatus Pacebacteria bacterium]|nr:2-oxoacid:acceptor oxidoreductase family protein [Candidatus Paceibacterota bacterium]MDR3583469.1 2-oxoacid:acceptor oxidoreductase family protein [Candidatus Paceibacterota bacterium]